MINKSDNTCHTDLFDGNFEENLREMSADQLNDIDIKKIQEFTKQKEREYKKDYEEFRGYYDFYSKNINNKNISGYEENKNKIRNKLSEMKQKYWIYIYDRNEWDKIPQDFEGNRILSENKIYKQYEFMRKEEHTKKDFDSLWTKENLIAIFSPYWYGIAHIPKIWATWEALKITDGLERMRWEINKCVTSENFNDEKRKSFYARNLKLVLIRYFVGLRYLLDAAKQYGDIENTNMIQGTIDYLLNGIRKLDMVIKNAVNETPQEIFDTIK